MAPCPHTRRVALADLDDAGAEWAKLKQLEAARECRDQAITAAAGSTRRGIARHARVKPTRVHQVAANTGGALRRDKRSPVGSTADGGISRLLAQFTDVAGDGS